MANIRKTFNFRNGVQVDEDNFIVDALGKVGIGTTVPTQFLDVRGDAKVVGIITSQSLETRNANIAGVSTFSGNTHVGSAITFYPATGIISATSLYGDGSKLINVPGSQWIDIDVGLGHTSIYNSGFVGVSTNDPRFTLQVGGNNDLTAFANGVGINSSGDIHATGIVTANNFKGFFTGNHQGTSTGHLNGTTLNVSGISTFIGQVNFDNPDAGKDVQWQPTNDRLSFMDNVKATFGSGADFSIKHDGSDAYLQNTGSGLLYLDATSTIVRNKAGSQDVAKFTEGNSGCALYCSNGVKLTTIQEGILVTGIASAGQFTGKVNAGIATVTTNLDLSNLTKLGVGIAPQSNFHVRSTGISSIHVDSGSSSEAVISVGKGINLRQTSGEIVYDKAGLTYSGSGSLDVINYNNGNSNNIIHLGSQAGINTGAWNWIYGKDATNPKMTLTYMGNLGIGRTNPTNQLEVVGTSTVTNNAFVGQNLSVAGNTTLIGNITVKGTSDIPIDGLNLNVTTGHSKVKNVDIDNALRVSGITTLTGDVSIGGTFRAGHFGININSDGAVAIGTDDPVQYDIGLDARYKKFISRGVGIGTTAPRAAVDFADAGRPNYDVPVQTAEANRMYMYPPKVLTSERNALAGLTKGALVFNTSTDSLEVYNGSAWTAQTAGGATNLNALSDVTTTTPSNGQFLKYNGTKWVNATGSVGNLTNLGDVTISSPSSNQVLKYNGTAWVNAASPSGLVDVVSDTTPELGGNLDTNGKNIEFGDSSGASDDRLTFGFAGDLAIYHSGSHSFISDTGTGDLKIQGSPDVVIEDTSGNNSAVFNTDAGVELFWRGGSGAGKKFETTENGVTVTGDLTCSAITVTRNTYTATANSLASGSQTDITIVGHRAYALLKVAVNHPSWVVLYVDDASRTADDSRSEGTDPAPGSGVIAEVTTTTAGSSTFLMSPGLIGWNNDSTVSKNVYVKVKNKDSVTRSITVSLTMVPIQA